MKRMIKFLGMLVIIISGMLSCNVMHTEAATLDSNTIRDYVLGRVGNSYPDRRCLQFVEECYQNLGGSRPYNCCASGSGNIYIKSSSSSDIPVGATVYFGRCGGGPCGSCKSSYYGHVGIYVGDGYFVHATGGKVQKSTLSSWGNKYRGWGCCGNFTLNTGSPAVPQAPEFGTLLNLGDEFSARIKNAHSGKFLTNLGNFDVYLDSGKNELYAKQIWKFKRNGDGSYKITSSVSGMAIDLDCAKNEDGANVKLYEDYGTAAQNWFIYQRNDGTAVFRSALSETRVFDLTSGSTEDGTNLQLFTFNDTSAQKFCVDKCDPTGNFGDDFHALILNKDCWKPVMVGEENRLLLSTETIENHPRQLWHFIYQPEDGSYSVQSHYNGCYLDVMDNGDYDGAPIGVREGNGNSSQRWFVTNSGNGYQLRPARSSRTMDVALGLEDDGTPIQLWAPNGTSAQNFAIYKISGGQISYHLFSDSASIDIGEKTKITVADALYAVNYKLYIISPDGKTKKVSLGVKNTYDFSGDTKGMYKLYAGVASPVSYYTGSENENYITVAVGYDYEKTEYSKVFQGHLYQLIKRPNVHWGQAKAFCEDRNSYLSAITSQEENNAVAALTEQYGGSVYIGGIRKDDNGFRWVNASGEEFSYSNWSEGEPNNTYHGSCQMKDMYGDYGRENYIGILANGKWNDYPIVDSNVTAFLMESNLASLEINVPSGISYQKGETFDKNDITVEAIFSDGSKREVTDYTISGFNPDKTGMQNVVISYYGMEKLISVQVGQDDDSEPGNKNDTPNNPPADTEQGEKDDTLDNADSEEEETGNMEEGDIFQDDSGNAEYEVISKNGDEVYVEYTENLNPKAAVVRIPATIEAEDGTICKVTSIASGAFKKNKKIKKVYVGRNVETIGSNAFYGCKNLALVSMGKNLVSIGSNAFSGCVKLTSLTIPAKVKKIGSNAFYGCKKLKKMMVKTTQLTSKSLGRKAFKGIPAKTVIRVPESKQKSYRKIFYKKGLNRRVKIK